MRNTKPTAALLIMVLKTTSVCGELKLAAVRFAHTGV